MYKHVCAKTNIESEIFIMPDYCSTGIWCKECGSNLGCCSLKYLPEWIFDFTELWNNYWVDNIAENENDRFLEFHKEKYFRIGKTINRLINFYYICEFKK